MAIVFIFSIFLQALLYATCFAEPCSNNWATATTKYTVLTYEGQLYLSVSCIDRNFKVDGEVVLMCVHGMVPTRLPQCVQPTGSCRSLKVPAYGSKKCSDSALVAGSTCTFECRDTHYLSGSGIRTCTEDLRWTGSAVTCFPKTGRCPHLKSLTYSSLNCSATAPEVGSTCTFECQDTHYMRGSKTRICAQNLRWTGSQPRCHMKKECKDPPPPLHQGTVVGCSPNKTIRFNDVCKFRCNEGFELVGPSQLTCGMNGKLTDEKGRQAFPSCRRAQKNPYPLSRRSCQLYNGYCSQSCHQEPEGIRCSCHSGYQLSQLDRKTCHDVDECAYPYQNKCEHTCVNTLGSYRCSCVAGYSSPDGFRCEAEITAGEVDTPAPFFQVSCADGYMPSRDGRYCDDIDECADEYLNKCEHVCRNTVGGFVCLCRTGYSSPDGFRCEDINECLNSSSNKCDHTCVNTIGGYICSCRAGFVSPDGFRCEGCRVNSYQARNEVACRECPANSHTEGEEKTSIEDCICNRGFTGNPSQGIPCKDTDECADGKNFGCSHICINTPGSAQCACPIGYHLKEDGKTCTDVDECSIKNGGCEGICHNTIGNFTCSCPEGFEASTADRYRCDDVDECADANGGCSDQCVNFKGGFHCSCSEGHHLHPDGRSCIVHTVNCPRVPVPHHSSITCRNRRDKDKKIFRPGEMPEDVEFPVGTTCKVKCDKGYDIRDSNRAIECQNDGKWNATLEECRALRCPPLTPPSNGDVYPPSCQEESVAVKQKCVFTCHSGYRIAGQEVLSCRNNLTWSKKKATKCVPETDVSISCPDDDITIELMSNEGWAEVQLTSPRTTLDAGPIRVDPPWVSLNGTSVFPAGDTEVTFSVTKDNRTAECSISVIVQDKHPPVFSKCPETPLIVTSNIAGTVVNWDEPVAEDNVGIASVSKSLEPNSTLSPGLHFVEYVARDFSGNIAQCGFHINVSDATGGCKDLMDPENGEANCFDLMFGKICQPSCYENFTRPLELFACDESGNWTPTNFISPCLPECFGDETWSLELQKCVKLS